MVQPENMDKIQPFFDEKNCLSIAEIFLLPGFSWEKWSNDFTGTDERWIKSGDRPSPGACQIASFVKLTFGQMNKLHLK